MRRLACFAAFWVALSTPCVAQGLDGEWARGDGQARVRIEACGTSTCAINTWIKDPASSEKVGDRLIMNVEASGPNKFAGQASDPQRGLTYNIEIDMALANAMTTRGCVLGHLLCKTVGWTRIK